MLSNGKSEFGGYCLIGKQGLGMLTVKWEEGGWSMLYNRKGEDGASFLMEQVIAKDSVY